MANLAAIIPAAQAPLEVKQVEKYTPGPKEILVKNEAIALIPVEAKIAKFALIPIPYPANLGLSYGGTVEAVGAQVTRFKAGDRVGVRTNGMGTGLQYGGYQRYVVAPEDTATQVPDGVEVGTVASILGNLNTVLGLFNARAKLDRPALDGNNSSANKSKKVLIYGGTSNLGTLSVQYVAQAGYSVVTTTSPKHARFVESLGPVHVVDHTQDHAALVKALVAQGPYDLVVDTISLPPTVAVNAAVVAAQGGGQVLTTSPPFGPGPHDLPEGVTRVFASWPDIIPSEGEPGLELWAYKTYLPHVLASGTLIPPQTEKVPGGLAKGVNDALDKLIVGVSGVRLIVDPWE
ncbi:hypothetical protein A1O3_00380 [Capronia epimyces CBS 606.96]|uniref:Alcohol dehydrogenase-like N-terminal domain-containing protein n=1 Tax=Capronia epimyces CBS 606.96 TaxID=1182542 RepID=W9YQA9_9EURO|nr:uncharacterized protein A1O3_00380 [Capronia epimyces CBS 606.96]EXJ91830.1 hypothetical protein A1O3_00380 [Capronia epimyces CBS 606.96]